MTRTFHYVRHHDVYDWLRCGWIARKALHGIHHGEWSVLCEFLCDCKLPLPNTVGGSNV